MIDCGYVGPNEPQMIDIMFIKSKRSLVFRKKKEKKKRTWLISPRNPELASTISPTCSLPCWTVSQPSVDHPGGVRLKREMKSAALWATESNKHQGWDQSGVLRVALRPQKFSSAWLEDGWKLYLYMKCPLKKDKKKTPNQNSLPDLHWTVLFKKVLLQVRTHLFLLILLWSLLIDCFINALWY